MTIFFDSNILIYAVSGGDPRKMIAMRYFSEGGVMSVQVMNEFAAVAHRKLKMSWEGIEASLKSFRKLVRLVRPIDVETHESALALAARNKFAFYDACIVASALQAKCDILLSEDMNDGMRVEDRLVIKNPFHPT